MNEPLTTFSTAALAARIAARAVVTDIETEAIAVELPEGRHYDTRPMLDPLEHDAICVDMARESITYALETGLIRRHSTHLHLVQILRSYITQG